MEQYEIDCFQVQDQSERDAILLCGMINKHCNAMKALKQLGQDMHVMAI